MHSVLPYEFLADAVLVLHFGVVLFVVGGLVFVVVGNMFAWPWVNSLWFRLAHVLAIGVVIAQAWLGKLCPLTTLESWLRVKAGSAAYGQSFIEYWVQRVLYYEAPFWVFTLVYTAFGLLVLAAWWYFPPRKAARAYVPSRATPSSEEPRAPMSATLSPNLAWVLLVVAGLLEIVWAVSMKASHGFTKHHFTAITLVAAALSFWLLGLALRQLPVGTAYAVWTGIGAVGAAILGIVLLGESLSVVRIGCIALIVIGILGLKFLGGESAA